MERRVVRRGGKRMKNTKKNKEEGGVGGAKKKEKKWDRRKVETKKIHTATGIEKKEVEYKIINKRSLKSNNNSLSRGMYVRTCLHPMPHTRLSLEGIPHP